MTQWTDPKKCQKEECMEVANVSTYSIHSVDLYKSPKASIGSLVIITFWAQAFLLWEPSLPSAQNTKRAISSWLRGAVACPISAVAFGTQIQSWHRSSVALLGPGAVLAAAGSDQTHFLEFPTNIWEVGFWKTLTSCNPTGSRTYPLSGICNKVTNFMINWQAGEADDANTCCLLFNLQSLGFFCFPQKLYREAPVPLWAPLL